MSTIIKNLFVCLQCIIQFSWAADAQNIHLGFFYCPYLIPIYCGVAPPRIDCNGLYVHESVLCSGKGDTAFLLPVVKCIIPMSTTKVKKETGFPYSPMAVKALHNVNRPDLIQSLYNRSIQQLINDFIVEMDAKNKAYYFILEHGHFDAFRNYCLTANKG